jgi:hypothetical protein
MRRTLVGAYAVVVYAYLKATKDIDIFVRAAPERCFQPDEGARPHRRWSNGKGAASA